MNRSSISPRGSILQFKSNNSFHILTEHNRSPLDIGMNRIEQSKRMANGTLRKFWVADKKIITVSWDMVPNTSSLTVDGGWGAQEIRDFYSSVEGKTAFDIRINLAKNGSSQENSGYEELTVMFTSANFTVVKRGLQPHWNVSITLEEV